MDEHDATRQDLLKANSALKAEIEERKRAEERLRESEERYRIIAENAGDGIITTDEDSTILLINPAAERIFGYERGELNGRPLAVLMPGNLRQAHMEAVKRYVATGIRHVPWTGVRFPGLRRDGTEVPLEMSFGEFVKDGRHFFTGIVRDVSEQTRLETALRESEQSKRLIMDAVPAMIAYVDGELRYRFVNRQYEKWFGLPARQIVGRRLRDVLGERQYNEFLPRMEKALAGEQVACETTIVQNGAERYLAVEYVPHVAEGHVVTGFFSLITDITERKRQEEVLLRGKEALRAVNERLAHVLNTITDGFVVLDRDWRFLEMNPRAEEFFGRPAGELIGRRIWDEYPGAAESEAYRQYRTAVGERRPVHFETFSVILKRWVEVHAYPRDSHLEIYFRDISRRKKMEELIRHQASHDELTGLANRALFEDHLRLEIAESGRNGRKLALLYLDLDRFKVVNDTLGHDAGDELLKQVARRIKACTRESDTVARIGGDEFNILVSDIRNAEDTTLILRKIKDCFERAFPVKGQALHTTASIGIAVYPDDSRDAGTLLKYADIAMYHAKEQGRNNYQFYSAGINKRTVERMRLEGQLRRAIEREELKIYYQPLADLDTGRLIAIEALLRWQHSELGLLRPEQFVSVAEEAGLMLPIGEWALRTACAQNRSWQAAGHPPVCMTLNLSPRQFRQPDLAEKTLRILEHCRLDPQWLEFEIRETTAMEDFDFTSASMKKLVAKGVMFSLDDFGTGCSSLDHLKRLPIQKIKIDRSFIEDIPHDPDHRAIVRAVIAMAHSLQLKTIAVGVETEAQVSFLKKNHCDEMQGYLFKEPLPADKFSELMAAQR